MFSYVHHTNRDTIFTMKTVISSQNSRRVINSFFRFFNQFGTEIKDSNGSMSNRVVSTATHF